MGCFGAFLCFTGRRNIDVARLKDKKKEDFAQEYAKTGNAYQSAITAGYSERYSKGNSYKLVENSGISARIQEIHQEIEQKLINRTELEPPMSDEELLSLLYGVARKRPFKGRSRKAVTEDGETVISEAEYQYSPNTEEQLSALDKISRIKGLYKDKLSIEGDIQYNVDFDV